MTKECKHEWEEIGREKRTKGHVSAGLFTQGLTWYEFRILQQCKLCRKYNVVIF